MPLAPKLAGTITRMLPVAMRRAWPVADYRASALACLALLLGGCGTDEPVRCPLPDVSTTQYHGTRARLGWNRSEAFLNPAALLGGRCGKLWESPEFDRVEIGGTSYAPHLYASPLYVDGVELAAAHGRRLGVVFAATSNGWVYAVSAFNEPCVARQVPLGTILWKTSLGTPAIAPTLDGGMPMGVLSTPVIDLSARPPTLYAAAMDAGAGWRVFALDVATGRVLSGWPVVLDDSTLGTVNKNGPARFQEPTVMSQRAALALSPGGDRLYVGFGTYRGQGVGFIAAVDTRAPALRAAFSTAPWLEPSSNGGMWGAAGPTVDDAGAVWISSGNSPPGTENAPRVWGNSLLRFGPDLDLTGTYTPFNYCNLDAHNMDVAASPPLLIPDLDSAATPSPRLLVFGGKQGNLYLVDRERLPGMFDARPPCNPDPASDGSLLPPNPQPQFGTRGPLNVFGPYSETIGELDYAKMRTKVAYYEDGSGTRFVYATGQTKAAVDSQQNVAPGLVRVRIVTPSSERRMSRRRRRNLARRSTRYVRCP